MTWREAFWRQAESDNQLRLALNQPNVAYSHRLHYLQMVTEKLSRSFLMSPSLAEPPPKTHKAFTRFLQTIKAVPNVQNALGFDDPRRFKAYIWSLLDVADRVERLAPNLAGDVGPNAEYPWWDPATGDVYVPCDYDFRFFDPTSPRMIKLEQMLSSLLRSDLI